MRIKAIPEEAIGFVEKHPAYLIGGAGVAIIGYMLFTHQAASTAANSGDTSTPYGYGSPIVYGATTGSGDTSSGAVGGTSTAATDTTPTAPDYTQQILDQQSNKDNMDFIENMASLQTQLKVATENSFVTLAGIQAQNYSAATALATGFLNSGMKSAGGVVTGPDGADFSFAFADSSHTESLGNVILPALQKTTQGGYFSADSVNPSYASLVASASGIGGQSTSPSAPVSPVSSGSTAQAVVAASPQQSKLPPALSAINFGAAANAARRYAV